MKALEHTLIDADLDARERAIRELVYDRLPKDPPLEDAIVASYFVSSEASTIGSIAVDVAKLQTTAVDNPPPGSLLERCTGRVVDVQPWDNDGRLGLVRIAFPVEILESSGSFYSTEIFHIVSGAVQHDLTASTDVKLVDVLLPDRVQKAFPGPAFGADGFTRIVGRQRADSNTGPSPLLGTIVKPCSGITTDELVAVVDQACQSEQIVFIKEDENLHPDFPWCPLEDRAKRVQRKVEVINAGRSGSSLVYAPHITSSPSRFSEHLRTALDAGVSAVMFSETYAGGLFRLARDIISAGCYDCLIYGHNGGIGTRSRSIYREVLDLFARLDGIDFRQTAPSGDTPYLRPAGLEHEKTEEILQRPLQGGQRPVVIVRAGGLDQGNLLANLREVERVGVDRYLFLFGSAINGFEGSDGEPDPAAGVRAVEQAVEAYSDPSHTFDTLSGPEHVVELSQYAEAAGMRELGSSLRQRYNDVLTG